MTENTCEVCGRQVSSYNSIIVSTESRHKLVCLPCFNKEISEAASLDYEHVELQPVFMKDADGITHKFHFAVKLLGYKLTIEAFELVDGHPGGYKFGIGGDVEDGLFRLFSKLYERMVKALERKHVYRSEETGSWQIQSGKNGKDIVRGQITSDIDSEDSVNMPLIIVDGKELTWEEFGKTLMTFEGFNFKLQIFDPYDEID